MPLHLLGKKSWNVYNPTAIARVRADEARSAAREEAQNELELAYQADLRLATLRGLPAPSRPAELDVDLEAEFESGKRREQRDKVHDVGREERKRKRKRIGEDDTDMELRVAKEEMDARRERAMASSKHDRDERREKETLPLTGEDGHIQLFAPASPSGSTHDTRKKGPEEVLRKKQQQEREGGSLRFDAAGGNRANPATTPWYAGSVSKSTDTIKTGGTAEQFAEEVGRDAWGNEDAGRRSRDAARMSTADPMAMMQMAQRKLKAVEREREAWKKEREVEVGIVSHAAEDRHSRDRYDRSERGHRSRQHSRSRSRERRHRHHRRRSRSRSRSPDREHRRRHRAAGT